MRYARAELLAKRSHQWALLAALCFGALMVRLAWVQLFQHSYYLARAERTTGRHWTIPAPRGEIRDRHGLSFALNLRLYTIVADPKLMDNLPRAAARLSPVLRLPPPKLLDLLTGKRKDGTFPDKPLRYVRLRENVDEPTADAVQALGIPGLVVRDAIKRAYPKGVIGASLIGFVGRDAKGLSGIEARFNKTLAGADGQQLVMLDGRLPRSRGEIPGLTKVTKEMRPGHDVFLTIDATLQSITDQALTEAVETYHAKGGAAVVMDPSTGEVLALANQPTFDPNEYQKSHPASWTCQAVTSPYEPGSTFKTITACAALEEGLYAHGETIDCQGQKMVGNRPIRCAHAAHHTVNLHAIIVRSCNIGACTVGLELGPERLYGWATKLGIGVRTGIEIPGETDGELEEWARWPRVKTANVAFGQGVSVTPVQLLSAYCTVANGGYRVEPHVIKAMVSEEGIQNVTPGPRRRVLSEQTCAFMKRALQGVVEEERGTGGAARVPGRTVGGKTGTAQKAPYRSGKFIGSFIGFAPVSDPKLAVIVLIDEPQGGHYGGVVAAPAFQKIMEKGLTYLHVPLDAELKKKAAGPGGSAAE